jgi:nitrate reductase molybdenum cofactor assembly chaperone NarJ/NarW
METGTPTFTLKILSALLCYPEHETQGAISDMRAALDREALCVGAERQALEGFLDELAASDLYDLQERYVLLFDRSRALSLHIFEHVHGESRDRGQAMIDLKSLYEKAGMSMAADELPDFLPLFLEFCSTQPPASARELLGQPAHVLAALAERLKKRDSSYEIVIRAIMAIADAPARQEDLDAILAEPEVDPDDLATLDAAWEEGAVTFGPGAEAAVGGCGSEALAARLRHAKRAVPTIDNPLHSGGL